MPCSDQSWRAKAHHHNVLKQGKACVVNRLCSVHTTMRSVLPGSAPGGQITCTAPPPGRVATNTVPGVTPSGTTTCSAYPQQCV